MKYLLCIPQGYFVYELRNHLEILFKFGMCNQYSVAVKKISGYGVIIVMVNQRSHITKNMFF